MHTLNLFLTNMVCKYPLCMHLFLFSVVFFFCLQRGKRITQAMFINDMDGFGMSHILQQGITKEVLQIGLKVPIFL